MKWSIERNWLPPDRWLDDPPQHRFGLWRLRCCFAIFANGLDTRVAPNQLILADIALQERFQIDGVAFEDQQQVTNRSFRDTHGSGQLATTDMGLNDGPNGQCTFMVVKGVPFFLEVSNGGGDGGVHG